MENKILVETSARHVHLSQADLETLFGKGFELTFKKALSQPGQFATNERVDIVGPKKELKNVGILGPVRPATQVEISLTDARTLGVAAPVRESGDIAGTPGCKIVGPKGEIEIENGVIVAKRHIHMTPDDAEKYGLQDKQIVEVKVASDDRTLTFGDVVVRVHPNFSLAMHIDTDEANAALCKPGTMGVIL
jgi:putative phosphotransacetylase